MTRTTNRAGDDVAAAISGDESAFAALAERHRRIEEITTFGAAPFPAFGLAPTL
jgi:precorrin-4 methylase